MATIRPFLRPLARRTTLRGVVLPQSQFQRRWLTTVDETKSTPPASFDIEASAPAPVLTTNTTATPPSASLDAESILVRGMKAITVHPAKPPIKKTCANPLKAVDDAQIKALDPEGLRTRLFSKTNPDGVGAGDILLVRQKNGDPFAGVCLNIRRRGIDTGILLRSTVMHVGVEAWFKIYSPNVEAIEVVRKREKRPRRERLYYMRKPKHDIGSVENIIKRHETRRRALGATHGTGERLAAFKERQKPKEAKDDEVKS